LERARSRFSSPGGLGPTSDEPERATWSPRCLAGNCAWDAGNSGEKSRLSLRNAIAPCLKKCPKCRPKFPKVLWSCPIPTATAPGLAMEISPNLFPTRRQDQLADHAGPAPPREIAAHVHQSCPPAGSAKSFPLEEAFVLPHAEDGPVLGESYIEEKDRPQASRRSLKRALELGYCAHYGEADVRVNRPRRGARKKNGRRSRGHHPRTTKQIHLWKRRTSGLKRRSSSGLLTERKETLALSRVPAPGATWPTNSTNVPRLVGGVSWADW